MKMYLKLEIHVVCREFSAFKYIFIVFFLKLTSINGFSIHNIHMYLCGQVENTKWILFCSNICVKCAFSKISTGCPDQIGGNFKIKLFHNQNTCRKYKDSFGIVRNMAILYVFG